MKNKVKPNISLKVSWKQITLLVEKVLKTFVQCYFEERVEVKALTKCTLKCTIKTILLSFCCIFHLYLQPDSSMLNEISSKDICYKSMK